MFKQKKSSETAFVQVKRLLSDHEPPISLNVKIEDFKILKMLIKQRNDKIIGSLDKYEADCKLFENICLASILFIFVDLGWVFLLQEPKYLLWFNVLSIVVFVLSYFRSHKFHNWFFEEIYFASLEYGYTLKEIVEFSHQTNLINKSEIKIGLGNFKE